ncbi:CoA transferase [Pseudomonas sp. RIT-PI-AD]|uniref:CoA transferase n=1 Tax=Pseudomonas sp. RIT-PI-AD TaxID=3035294 RepID=UPI0021DA378C|nr:CoA transferase [Pseudomonas sp. RIT-PI-AD]
MSELLSTIEASLDLPPLPDGALRIDGEGALPSAFAVTELATASLAAAGSAVSSLLRGRTGEPAEVRVDRRLASFWFAGSIRPRGWSVPPAWDPLAGDYATRDGWIRLHTNAPHHRASAERVLGRCADAEALAARVAGWTKGDLERAIVEAGGCAAEMRSWQAWKTYPQGRAVNAEPLVWRESGEPAAGKAWTGSRERPLAGIRVLDLTRVLAGPVASRFLAGLGAEVLRIDPPGWDEAALVPEVTLGKRCARLDLHDRHDRATFERLLADADVMLHGYRADALERLGYGAAQRRALAPTLVDVSLNAYGWSGPWRNRRGFDSLVQMSCGVAEAGMRWRQAERPLPLPVQALDHATGYLMAAAAIRALSEAFERGCGGSARLSLARTARLLVERGAGESLPLRAEDADDREPALEASDWGPAQRLRAPLHIAGLPLRWSLPARRLGSAAPAWS